MKTIAKSPDGRSWRLETERDEDGDGFAYNEHFAVALDNGERRHCDWSRFYNYSDQHFTTFVAAGFPRREGLVPWRPVEIDALAVQRAVAA